MNGIPGPPGPWQEARTPEGKVYYYNAQTKATQWTKPLDLMTPAERALSTQPWKEYTAENGRKYYVHSETKESSWQMPEAYKNALAQSQPPPRPAAPAQTFVAGGTTAFPTHPQQRERDDYSSLDRSIPDRRNGFGASETSGMAAASVGSQQQDPDYQTFEEAEAAFLKLLRRANVQPEWTWEQTMRATIKDPQYRSLKDPKDRKTAFEKYAVEVRMQEKDRAKERLAKLRTDFGTMLRSHPEIKHYTRWKTIRPIIEGETIFRSTNDENERRQLFEEYVVELKKAHLEQEAMTRKAAMDELVAILKALDLEPYTRWSEAQGLIQSNERIQKDAKFKTLNKSDILTVFENHVKALERTFNDARQQQKASRARRERQNRDQFLKLLKELSEIGKIKAGTKWMQVLPLIEEDHRYVAMLGQAGSTPLDLFWDMVEEEERALRGRRNDVLDVLDDKRYEITQKTTFDDFFNIMTTDRRTASIDRDILFLIFDRLHDKVIRRTEDEKHSAERQQRRAVDNLRSRIKHLEPAVRTSDTWDTIRPRVERLEEFKAVESDELRRSAFEKVLRRLKEKEEDAEKERERDRERDRSRRDHRHRDERDRERDRDSRNGHGVRDRRSHPSRTPEADAYEADRRKAQADRERQYRKASVSGLSPPPPSRRDRDDGRLDRGADRDRDRDRDRERDGDRHGRLTHYDRERKNREEERERMYRTRGDPRGSRDELDYGGGGDTRSTTGSVRRRRGADSDGESVGSGGRKDAKRYRRDEKTPRTPRDTRSPIRDRRKSKSPPKPEPAVHSGSEEGEIEEE